MTDTDKIIKELKDGYQEEADLITKEYKGYMIADNVHLYTTYNDVNATTEVNKYAEFRIIQVGEHASALKGATVDGNVLTQDLMDGSTLTFHAVHSLPTAYPMNSTDTNEGRWGATELCQKLQEEGEIFNNFPTELTSAIKKVNKVYYMMDEKKTSNTTQNKFFLLSNLELVDNDDKYNASYPTSKQEGRAYDFFKTKIETQGDSDLISSILKTRSGATPLHLGEHFLNPLEYDPLTGWWLRTVSSTALKIGFNTVGERGNFSCGSAAFAHAVAPAFCF